MLKPRPARSAWAAVLLAVGTAMCGPGPVEPMPIEPPPEEALAVLFVGNSLTYANDLPGLVQVLLDSAGVGPLWFETRAQPNWGLEDHWAYGAAPGAIRRGGWDVVVLQQGPSATEGRPSLLAYTALFAQLADSIGARTALYMVWPASARPFDFDGVSESYATAARNVNGLLFPVGEAWRDAWDRDRTLALYGTDGYHPSMMGTYLAAAVMFEQLANRSPIGLPASVRWAGGRIDLTADEARILQEAAAEANAEFGLH